MGRDPQFGHRSAREYHTRLGWWVMTHDRGGAVLIACVTLAVAIGDLVWLVVWRGKIGGDFGWGLLAGVLLVAGMLVAPRMIDLAAPTVQDRDSARAKARMINSLGFQFIAAVFVLRRWLGNDASDGALLAETALFATFMTVWCIREAIRPSHPMAAHYRAETEQVTTGE